jgi:hypothetical protein
VLWVCSIIGTYLCLAFIDLGSLRWLILCIIGMFALENVSITNIIVDDLLLTFVPDLPAVTVLLDC